MKPTKPKRRTVKPQKQKPNPIFFFILLFAFHSYPVVAVVVVHLFVRWKRIEKLRDNFIYQKPNKHYPFVLLGLFGLKSGTNRKPLDLFPSIIIEFRYISGVHAEDGRGQNGHKRRRHRQSPCTTRTNTTHTHMVFHMNRSVPQTISQSHLNVDEKQMRLDQAQQPTVQFDLKT